MNENYLISVYGKYGNGKLPHKAYYKTVEGTRIGRFLGIHFNGKYHLTHIPSGHLIGTYATFQAAYQVAMRLIRSKIYIGNKLTDKMANNENNFRVKFRQAIYNYA